MQSITRLVTIGVLIVAAISPAVAAQKLELAQASQTQVTRQPAKPAPALAPTAAPAPAVTTAPNDQPPPPVPTRTETLTFESWTVTCREFADPKLKRSCVAQIEVSQSSSGQIVLLWIIGLRDDHQLEGVLRVPTGVNIPQGIEIRAGTGPGHKVTYATCEPAFCTASTLIDANWKKEILAAESFEFTIFGSGGNSIKLNVPAKGAEKAIAALAR